LIAAVCASILCILLSGCLFEAEPYKPVKYYDLKTPQKLCPEGVDLDVQIFRMEASSKYKMLYRMDSTRVLVDDYNKWTQTPGFMLSRYLQSAFSSNTNPEKLNNMTFVLLGAIFTFEIDLEKNQAVLGVKYELKRKSDGSILLDKSRVFSESFPDSKDLSPETFAKAMSAAASKFANKLRTEIVSIKEEEKKALLKKNEKTQKQILDDEKNKLKKQMRENEIEKAQTKAILEKAEAEKLQAEIEKEKAKAELHDFKEKLEETKRIKAEAKKIKENGKKFSGEEKTEEKNQ
jgi:ABC-type uncharacterized transport system auxiliary subunit